MENILPSAISDLSTESYKTISQKKQINHIALLGFIITEMGDSYFSPEDVKAKLGKEHTITVRDIDDCMLCAVLYGFFSICNTKYKNRMLQRYT